VAFPWETAIAAGASSALSILGVGVAVWNFYLKDLRQGLIDLRKDVVELHKAERQERSDVWTQWRDTFKLRIGAIDEARATEKDTKRQENLLGRQNRAQDEYLDLLDRAIQFPEAIDPGLRNTPEYLDFLKGRLDDIVLPEPVGGAPNASEEDQQRVERLARRVESLTSEPDTIESLVSLGNAYRYAGDYAEALQRYNRALELRPDDAGTLNNRGIALRNLGRYDEALADYNRALQLRPDHPDTLSNRVVALSKLGRYDEALADFNRALELRPDDPDTIHNRACLFRGTRLLSDLALVMSTSCRGYIHGGPLSCSHE